MGVDVVARRVKIRVSANGLRCIWRRFRAGARRFWDTVRAHAIPSKTLHLLMELPQDLIHKMWAETMSRLNRLHRCVHEGKGVLEAKDFCSWLQFSGYCKVFDLCPSSDPNFIVDGKAVRKKIDDLVYDCGEWFRSGKVSPKYHESDIAEINKKLDRLLDRKKQDAAANDDGFGPQIFSRKPRSSRLSPRVN